MGTKMKGLLKGLRYISQIFEEEKEAEMQIGNPTDVKHVAHIGWDGPSATVDNSPSWMKEFKSTGGGFQSSPSGEAGDSKENSEVKEDTKKGSRDLSLSDMPKSSRRQTSSDGANDSPKKKDESTRSRRRNQSKDSSDSVKSNRGESTSGNPPDIPKKSRRKKSKDCINVGSSDRSTRSRSKASDPRPEAERVEPKPEQ